MDDIYLSPYFPAVSKKVLATCGSQIGEKELGTSEVQNES